MTSLPDISELFETVCCKVCKDGPEESEDFFVVTDHGVYCGSCLDEKGTPAEKAFVGHVTRQTPPPGMVIELPVLH